MMPDPVETKMVTPSAVPAYSHFVLYSSQVRLQMPTWHKVEVGARYYEWTEAAYAWCDVHVHHAWTVKDDCLYFEDPADAVMFSLTILTADR